MNAAMNASQLLSGKSKMTFKFLHPCLVAIALVGIGITGAGAAGDYHVKQPAYQDWSFAGPFGHYDRGALQRGFKIYQEVCSSCHSIGLLAFRNLIEKGGPEFTEDQIKQIANDWSTTVIDADPDENGDPIERQPKLSDKIPGPWANPEQGAASNGGAYPPDFSLIAKARAVERGFPTFLFDIFTQYQEQGPDYIHALLTGYETGEAQEDGTYKNPHFIAAPALKMAPPLSDGVVTYDDGSPETVDQYAKDIAHFLMWVAEPKLEQRKALGMKVMIFLVIFAGLLYATKRRVFAGKH